MIHPNGITRPTGADSALEKNFLKLLRFRLGNISQETLAHRIGVSLNSVSRWERGLVPARLSIAQMKKFIKAIEAAGFSVSEIPDRLDAPPVKPRKKRVIK